MQHCIGTPTFVQVWLQRGNSFEGTGEGNVTQQRVLFIPHFQSKCVANIKRALAVKQQNQNKVDPPQQLRNLEGAFTPFVPVSPPPPQLWSSMHTRDGDNIRARFILGTKRLPTDCKNSRSTRSARDDNTSIQSV